MQLLIMNTSENKLLNNLCLPSDIQIGLYKNLLMQHHISENTPKAHIQEECRYLTHLITLIFDFHIPYGKSLLPTFIMLMHSLLLQQGYNTLNQGKTL